MRIPGTPARLALAGLGAALGAGALLHRRAEAHRQGALDPFYRPPHDDAGGPPGDVVRVERVAAAVAGATTSRVLYRTEVADGEGAVASALLFVPDGPGPRGGRPVVVWAHPTSGMGVAGAPSRTRHPVPIMTWLPGMLAQGWVVVAPDYHGLGTPGTLAYLVGDVIARDLVDAARAARAVAGASGRFGVWGHSAGGHAALFAATVAPTYAPELELVGVAAAAPASELVALFHSQWRTPAAWVIGGEILVAWPAYCPGLRAADVAAAGALQAAERLASDLLLIAGLEGLARTHLGQHLFTEDPMDHADWRAMAERNVPPVARDVPTLVVQGLRDAIVLPWSAADMAERWYAHDAPLSVQWMGGVGHLSVPRIGGPMATTWLEQRFRGEPAPTTRGTARPAITPRRRPWIP